MTTSRRLLASGILAGMAMASTGRAQNLIANGEFDSSAAGWARYFSVGPEPGFVAEVDHVEYAGSGSAVFAGSGVGVDNFMGTCITGLTPQAAYTLNGSVRFAVGGGGDSVALYIEWHDSTLDCAGTAVGDDLSNALFGGGSDVWTLLSQSTLVSPVGAGSALVMVYLFSPAAQVRVDSVHLVPVQGYISADAFEIGSGGRWVVFSPG